MRQTMAEEEEKERKEEKVNIIHIFTYLIKTIWLCIHHQHWQWWQPLSYSPPILPPLLSLLDLQS
jgi:hypothetical protein